MGAYKTIKHFAWVYEKHPVKTIIILLISLLTSVGANAQTEENHYFEEYKKGNPENDLKKRYKNFRQIYDSYSPEEKLALEKKGFIDFQKDNALLPFPRILSQEEAEILQKGVAQRGLALQAFLKDYYSGKNTFIKAGIIPKEVLDRIIQRHGEEEWITFIRPQHLNFWYGPDIIRAPPDLKNPKIPQFRIVEDNTDFIGGIGDLELAKESLQKNIPGYQKYINSPDPKKYYDELAESYFKRAKKYGGIPVMVIYPDKITADNEDNRMKKIFEDRGIKVVEIDPYTNNTRKIPRLETDKEGVWLIEKGKKNIKRIKVGYIAGNMNVQDFEPTHPANRRYRIISAAREALENKEFAKEELQRTKKLKELLIPDKNGKIDIDLLEKFMIEKWPEDHFLNRKKLGISGLLDAVFNGKVGLTNPPGLQFVNDKELYMYVDRMVEYYLKQKPIIPNIQTESFAEFLTDGKVVLRKKRMEEVFLDIDHWVIKGVDGRGGDAVWVGPKMDKSVIPVLKKRIEQDPSRFIFQRYTPLSMVDNHIVDLRLHSEITAKGKIIVSKIAWGRAISKAGDGKVNLSANGKEITILVKYHNRNCDMHRVYITNANKLLDEIGYSP